MSNNNRNNQSCKAMDLKVLLLNLILKFKIIIKCMTNLFRIILEFLNYNNNLNKNLKPRYEESIIILLLILKMHTKMY